MSQQPIDYDRRRRRLRAFRSTLLPIAERIAPLAGVSAARLLDELTRRVLSGAEGYEWPQLEPALVDGLQAGLRACGGCAACEAMGSALKAGDLAAVCALLPGRPTPWLLIEALESEAELAARMLPPKTFDLDRVRVRYRSRRDALESTWVGLCLVAVAMDIGDLDRAAAERAFACGFAGDPEPHQQLADRRIANLVRQYPAGRDEVRILVKLHVRMFEKGAWRKWISHPNPRGFLNWVIRRVVAEEAREVPPPDSLEPGTLPEQTAATPAYLLDQDRARTSLAAALRLLDVDAAALLHARWYLELDVGEIQHLTEDGSALHYRLDKACRTLHAHFNATWGEAIAEPQWFKPETQSRRRQKQTLALRKALGAESSPEAPIEWMGRRLRKPPRKAPGGWPDRAKRTAPGEDLSSGTRPADVVTPQVVDDQAITRIATGWLLACRWACHDRRARAARITHLRAMGFDWVRIGEVISNAREEPMLGARLDPEIEEDIWRRAEARVNAWLADRVGLRGALLPDITLENDDE